MECQESQQCIHLDQIQSFEQFENTVMECIAKELNDPFIFTAYSQTQIIKRELSAVGAYFTFEKRGVFCNYSGFVGSVDLMLQGEMIGGSMVYFDENGELEFIEAYFWDQNLFFLKLEKQLAFKNPKTQQCINLDQIKSFEQFENAVMECIAKELNDPLILAVYQQSKIIKRDITPTISFFVFGKMGISCHYSGYIGAIDLMLQGANIGGSRLCCDANGELEFIEAYFWDQNLFFLKLAGDEFKEG